MSRILRGVIRLSEEGIECFCPEERVSEGRCVCQKKLNLPLSEINITELPGTRLVNKPSSLSLQKSAPSSPVSRQLDKLAKEQVQLKRGLRHLESAISKATRLLK